MNDLTPAAVAGSSELIELSTEIVCAYVSHNALSLADLSRLIVDIHATLSAIQTNSVPAIVEELRPAVSVKKSINPDFIICLEDGKKLKMLKRHLMTRYGMTPDQYRAKWGLPADYPMVAPNYAEQRRTLAKSIGLGTKRVAKVGGKPRGRPRKVVA